MGAPYRPDITNVSSSCLDATGRRLPELVRDIQFIEVEGGPHSIGWTHPDDMNEALSKFVT